VINKPKTEKWHKAFAKGFLYGSMGGFLMYEGKNFLHLINKKQVLTYAWPARVVFSAGTSIAENASAHRHPFKNWHMNVGFARLELNLDEGKPRLGAKLLPPEFIFFTTNLLDKKLLAKESLQSGVFMYESRRPIVAGGIEFAGYALPGSVSFNKRHISSLGDAAYVKHYTYYLYAHELTHIFQYHSQVSFDKWFPHPKKYLPGHKFIHPNYNTVLWMLLYAAEGRKGYPRYFRNFFELEAEHFATKSRVIVE
jgi:hypothetical protein